ncbi:MAG: hypothetical protein CXT69_06895 [Methanobacteriota archaeon]|jgi:hypothetical protein|nr:MAG: hypothetical protein CXT69_06895 [Euryarchaeota archaeon]
MKLVWLGKILLYGLIFSLIMIPIMRWFWKRWDNPDEEVKDAIEQHKLAKEEEIIWLEKEAELQAEEMEKMKWVKSPSLKAPSEEERLAAIQNLGSSSSTSLMLASGAGMATVYDPGADRAVAQAEAEKAAKFATGEADGPSGPPPPEDEFSLRRLSDEVANMTAEEAAKLAEGLDEGDDTDGGDEPLLAGQLFSTSTQTPPAPPAPQPLQGPGPPDAEKVFQAQSNALPVAPSLPPLESSAKPKPAPTDVDISGDALWNESRLDGCDWDVDWE